MMSGTGNPVVDNAQKALHDLYLAHHGEGEHMYGVLHGYHIRKGAASAQQKQEATALILQLLGNGHISQWAAAQFQAYLAMTPAQIDQTGGLAPAAVPPSTIDKNLGDSIANLPKNLPKVIDINGFLSALASPHTWLRVAEVLLGVALIIVGLVKVAPPAVAQRAATVGKAAALL